VSSLGRTEPGSCPSAAPYELTGLILCSGKGRRMSADGQGLDKGLMPFRGRMLVEHVMARLSPQVGRLMLNAPDESRWRSLGRPLIQDQLGPALGPLAGMHAGMRASQSRWLLCVPCDAPLLPADLAERLFAAQRTSGASCVTATAAGRIHPVFALLDVALCDRLEAFLNTGARKVEAWLNEIDAAQCEFPDPSAFANLNTPSDLLELERA